MRESEKVITRSFCLDRDVYEAIKADAENLGYGSQSRVVNQMARKHYKLKPKENPYLRRKGKS